MMLKDPLEVLFLYPEERRWHHDMLIAQQDNYTFSGLIILNTQLWSARVDQMSGRALLVNPVQDTLQ